MKIQLIRNATLRVVYAGNLILIDPFLAAKHTLPAFAGVSPNPLTDLPCESAEVLEGIDCVFVSHLHPDHFDESAQVQLPKSIELFCQPGDETEIEKAGFSSVQPIETSVQWRGVTMTRTSGHHGVGEWEQKMGRVSGLVLQAADEPTLYWAGDTIWCDEVQQAIVEHSPGIIITHSGGARFGDDDPIIMDAEQTLAVCNASPDARVVAVHLETLDHCTVDRSALRKLADEQGIGDRLLIPADGEQLTFEN